ncbi:MAG: hypothetical protein ACE5IY_22980, partial [bacterium]
MVRMIKPLGELAKSMPLVSPAESTMQLTEDYRIKWTVSLGKTGGPVTGNREDHRFPVGGDSSTDPTRSLTVY